MCATVIVDVDDDGDVAVAVRRDDDAFVVCARCLV